MKFAVLALAMAISAMAQGTREFSLRSKSRHTHLNGRWIAELKSTDSGEATPIIFDHKGNSTLQISGYLLNGSFLVNQPQRQGGSEYDGWVVGPTNEVTATAVPEIQPAGSSQGWYFRIGAKGNTTLLSYQNAGNDAANFLICNRKLVADHAPYQQLVLGFSRRLPAACKKVELAVIFQ